MNIITFASTKGGVGKSTSAAIFVDNLLRSGETVRTLDFDDQGNFRKWVTGVAPRFPKLTFSEIEGRKDAGFAHYYNALVELFEDETAWVVMDTKGTDDPRQPAALAISDLVVAPSGPIENELAGVSKITEYLRLALKQSDPDVVPLICTEISPSSTIKPCQPGPASRRKTIWAGCSFSCTSRGLSLSADLRTKNASCSFGSSWIDALPFLGGQTLASDRRLPLGSQ